ncbi:MAG: cysteine hydrolase [Candidatus Marsarchaeota archaeon]|nr:cysteine hydrolase [Candidatus Marsarchaeota archaeon]
MANALVIVDAQNYFINESNKGIPKRIAQVADKVHFDFIIFLKFVNKDASNFVKDLNWKKMFTSPDTDIVPELEKLTKRGVVFRKTSFSAFRSKGFVDFITKNRIHRLYVCGFDTDGCVIQTALEAFDLGYEVRVFEDLCASHHGEDFHKKAISIMKRNAWSIVSNSKEFG